MREVVGLGWTPMICVGLVQLFVLSVLPLSERIMKRAEAKI